MHVVYLMSEVQKSIRLQGICEYNTRDSTHFTLKLFLKCVLDDTTMDDLTSGLRMIKVILLEGMVS
ncbi:hypothetical protein T10_13154 [Trichinella papuae]|uniref:Uncharacterized protein n=1 Tax=Trichinella papuae TaxID=268474 RepID=A0A0V1MWD4_9BILA|nr:hypothetical protein T10_13154 [Trichinella papuae]